MKPPEPKPAAACPVKFHKNMYYIPYIEVICDGYGVHVFKYSGNWIATDHIKPPMDSDNLWRCPPGPEFAEKMAKAWQAAADLIRQKQGSEVPSVAAVEPPRPARTFVVETVRPSLVGGFWHERGRPNLWESFHIELFPADVTKGQEYILEARLVRP